MRQTTYAIQDFLPSLQDHLAARILAARAAEDPAGIEITEAQRDRISFKKNRIYRHKVMRTMYTTYDMRREQDSSNGRSHPDLMVYSQDGEYPFWFCRMVGLFHADVVYENDTREDFEVRMDFAWVRWFGREHTPDLDTNSWRPPMLSFLPGGDEYREPFGFIDRADVVRGVHLIPAFAYGTTDEGLGTSSVRQPLNGETVDYKYYYVNM